MTINQAGEALTITNDLKLDNGMRWLTVRPPGSENQELLLMDPLHSMLDDETAQQVRALVAKGDHSTLAERGVEFTQEPAERPYGVEAIMRDDSGNWYSFTQHKFLQGTP